MPTVTIYTKPNCPLCDEALEQVELARPQTPFDLEEINILNDPVLYDRYKNAIPVVLVNGEEAFRYRLTAPALLKFLGACGQQ